MIVVLYSCKTYFLLSILCCGLPSSTTMFGISVHFQIRLFTETASALIASVLFDSFMHVLMKLKTSSLSKGTRTIRECTSEWLLTCVYPHVRKKVIDSLVILSALLAFSHWVLADECFVLVSQVVRRGYVEHREWP